MLETEAALKIRGQLWVLAEVLSEDPVRPMVARPCVPRCAAGAVGPERCKVVHELLVEGIKRGIFVGNDSARSRMRHPRGIVLDIVVARCPSRGGKLPRKVEVIIDVIVVRTVVCHQVVSDGWLREEEEKDAARGPHEPGGVVLSPPPRPSA